MSKPKPDAPRNARIYLRVSSQRQAEHGLTISRDGEDPGIQEELCRKLIAERGWNCAGVYSDPGITGRRSGIIRRIGLAKCIEDTCKDSGVIVFYDITRLGRNAGFLITLRERLQDAKAELISHTYREFFDTTSAYGVFVYGLLALVAQLESDMRSETSKVVHQKWRSLYGKSPTGAAPYGYKRVDNREVPCPIEQSIIREFRKARNKHHPGGDRALLSPTRKKKIAAELNANGILTIETLRNRAKNPPGPDVEWDQEQVRKMDRNLKDRKRARERKGKGSREEVAA